MTTKRNCETVCQAGILEHAFRRAICELDSIADILYGINLTYKKPDLSPLRQRIYNTVEILEKDIRETREASDIALVDYRDILDKEHHEHDEALEFEEDETKDRAA